jgi:cAMP phosphodiesterase
LQVLYGIEHLLLTHSHMDHIALLPMLCDIKNIGRASPLTVYALPETIEVLRKHIFNWHIWPDFAQIPDADAPVLRWHPIQPGDVLSIENYRVRVLPATHIVPGVGFAVHANDGANEAFAFQGDSGRCPGFWDALAQEDVDLLIVESAFSNAEESLALLTLHLSPALLAAELTSYKGRAQLVVTHAKPGEELMVEEQLTALIGERLPRMLRSGEIIKVVRRPAQER